MILPCVLFLLYRQILHFFSYALQLKKCLIDIGRKCTDEKTTQGIIDLHNTGIGNKGICIQKGLKLFSVQIIEKFNGGGSKNLLLPQKPPGRPHKVLERTRTLLRRQLKVNPSHTGCQIKERNLDLCLSPYCP